MLRTGKIVGTEVVEITGPNNVKSRRTILKIEVTDADNQKLIWPVLVRHSVADATTMDQEITIDLQGI